MLTPPRATLDRDGYLPTWALLTGGGQLLPMGDRWRWPGGGPMMAREPSERGEMHPTKPLMTNGKSNSFFEQNKWHDRTPYMNVVL